MYSICKTCHFFSLLYPLCPSKSTLHLSQSAWYLSTGGVINHDRRVSQSPWRKNPDLKQKRRLSRWRRSREALVGLGEGSESMNFAMNFCSFILGEQKRGVFWFGIPTWSFVNSEHTHTQNRVFHLVFCDLCKPYFETLHIFPINWVICRISKLHLVKVWCQKHPLRDLDHTLRDVSFVRHDLDIKRKIWRKQRRPMGPMDRWRFPHVRIHGIHGDPWEPWEPNLYAIYIPYKKVKCSWIGKCTPYI